MKIRLHILVFCVVTLAVQSQSPAKANRMGMFTGQPPAAINLQTSSTEINVFHHARAGAINSEDTFSALLFAASVNKISKLDGQTYAVAMQGAYVYVGVGPYLVVVDVSLQKKPKVIGKTSALPGVVRGMEIVSNYAYVVAGRAGLQVVDISNPSKPIELGAHDTPGNASGICVVESFAYVADGEAGIQIVDVSDPAAPMAVGAAATSGWDWDVRVVGNYAFVAGDEMGLRVVDVSDAAAPVQLASYHLPNDALNIWMVDHYAYVSAGGAGLRIIDVSDPKTPLEVDAYEHQFARSVYASGNYAYLATERSGMVVFEISNPAKPFALGSFETVGSANRVHGIDDYAFIADGAGGLFTIKFKSEKHEKEWEVFLPLTANGPNGN